MVFRRAFILWSLSSAILLGSAHADTLARVDWNGRRYESGRRPDGVQVSIVSRIVDGLIKTGTKHTVLANISVAHLLKTVGKTAGMRGPVVQKALLDDQYVEFLKATSQLIFANPLGDESLQAEKKIMLARAKLYIGRRKTALRNKEIASPEANLLVNVIFNETKDTAVKKTAVRPTAGAENQEPLSAPASGIALDIPVTPAGDGQV